MYIQRSGTSDTGRLAAAAHPHTAPVDNRSLTTLMNYARAAADLINYYGDDDSVQGTWARFFERNTTFFLAAVADYKTDSLFATADEFVLNYLLIKNVNAAEEKKRAEALVKFANVLFSLYDLVAEWKKKAQTVKRYTAEFIFSDRVQQVKSQYFDQYYNKLRVLQSFLIVEYEISDLKSAQSIDLSDVQRKKLSAKLTVPGIYKNLQSIFRIFRYQITQLHGLAKLNLEQELFTKHNHEPLTALLIGFLRTFQLQQKHLNEFTERHLNYYYYDVLGQKKMPAVSDYTYAGFQLNKDAEPHLLPQGTLLLADIDDRGTESHYETLHDIWISEANIAALHTLYVSRNPNTGYDSSYRLVSDIYFAPVADSSDGLGKPFDAVNKSWAVVGKDQTNLSPRHKTMVSARVGFAFSAPILCLGGGHRKITLTLSVTADSLAELPVLIEDIAANENRSTADIFYSLFRNSIEIFVTTESGWLQIRDFSSEPPEKWKNGALKLEINLGNDLPGIAPLAEEAEGHRYDSKWPVAEILLKSDSPIYGYSFFQGLELEAAEIDVEVTDFSDLTVSNAAGEFDNSTAFPLFGTVPEQGAEFLIGSRELFLKNVQSLDIAVEWKNLPDREGGFKSHYQGYKDAENQPLDLDNDSFKIKLSALSDSRFYPEKEENREELTLFSSADDRLKPVTGWRNLDTEKLRLTAHSDGDTESDSYNNDSRSGYIRCELTAPRAAFGHSEYPRSLADAVMHNAYAKAEKTWWKKDTPLLPVPKEPYDPVVRKISLNYTARSSISFAGNKTSPSEDSLAWKMYQITPFGFAVSYAGGQVNDNRLLQSFGWDGYLIIGIDKLRPGLPLNLLFEFSITGKKALSAPVEMSWRYLADNHFTEFRKEDFLYDTTYNFTSTGVVSLRIPESINKNNTILSDEYYWLLVSARGETAKILAEALRIKTHAVKVRWRDNGDPRHYQNPKNLPKIQSLLKSRGAIAEVTQIGDFFGGFPEESEEQLRARVSERMRHKQRAVTAWDYERIILQKFPEIKQVKCIGPVESDSVPPGSLKTVVIPQAVGADNLRPVVGFHVLSQIRDYLKTVCGSHVNPIITNPNYEWLKLSLKVILKPEFRNLHGKYLGILYRDIREFICPWTVKGDVRIGVGFYKKDLLAFIRSRPYIDFLTSFSVVHVYEEEKTAAGKIGQKQYEFNLRDSADPSHQQEDIRPSVPWGILVPADLHVIEFLDKPVFIPPVKAAVTSMALETDFLISAETEKIPRRDTDAAPPETDYFDVSGLV